jgi:zinc-ribbon domain
VDICTSCHADMRADARFCPRCGASRSGDPVGPDPEPEPPGPDPAPPRDHRHGSAGGAGSLVAVAVVVLLAVITTVLGLRSDDAAGAPAAAELPTAAPTTTIAPPQAGRPTVVAATATCIAKSSRDAGGTPTSYDAARAVDGDTTTAWRCQGDGSGQQLRLTFDGIAEIRRIGLIPGLAKNDPVDGTDRYAQNRRLSEVRYDFDDGTSVVQQFETSDANRSVQSVAVQGVRASSVIVTILGSVPGSEQNQQAPVDTVAISEVVAA